MKIECAYILYIDDPNSIKYMKECSQSCEKYNIPWLAIQWYKPPITTSELFANHDFNLNPRLDHTSNLIHLKEAMCSTGHISIWRRIYERHTGAVAIFEHDAVVKRDFKSVDVEDDEITFLGYRIDQSEDYECVSDEFTKLTINEFSGTHAYAITPNTAKHLLGRVVRKDQFTRLCENCQCDKEYLPVCSVDWWLGHNMLGLNKMTIVDPCPVVAVVGGRKSFTQYHERAAKFNAPANSGLPKKFMSGIINKNKYFVDEKQFLKFM